MRKRPTDGQDATAGVSLTRANSALLPLSGQRRTASATGMTYMDKSGPKERRLSDQQIWVAVICQVTGWNSATMGGRAAKLVKKLKAGGATKETVLAHYGQYDFGEAWWWYRDHWLGKKGERPNDRWMLETWGLWEKPIAVAGVSQGRLAVEMVTDAKGISRPKLTPEQQAIKDQFFSQDAAHADH